MNTTKSPHADSSITSATATAAREAYDAADKARSAAARNAQSWRGKVPSADALAALASARAVYAECKAALDAAVHARSAEAYAELFAADADLTLPRCKV